MSELFKKGIPWEADVQRIESKYPAITDGMKIPISDLESCINEPRTKSRFNGVTGSWRRKQERENKILIQRKNGCFIVLDNSGKVKVVESGYNSGVRKIYKAGIRARGTGSSGLSEEEMRKRDHVARTAANIACIAATAAKDIGYPDPIKQIS